MKTIFTVLMVLALFAGLAHGQNTNALVYLQQKEAIGVYRMDTKTCQTILSLDSIDEDRFFEQAIQQKGDTLLVEVYKSEQNGDRRFKRRRYYLHMPTWESLKHEEYWVKGEKSWTFITDGEKRKARVVDSISNITFEDESQEDDLLQKSRIVDGYHAYTHAGDIHMVNAKGQDSLLLPHDKARGNYAMKWKFGYRFPDLSNDRRKIICYDSHYNTNKKYTATKYIVEVDIETLAVTPIFEFAGGSHPILLHLMYVPDDRYIFLDYIHHYNMKEGNYSYAAYLYDQVNRSLEPFDAHCGAAVQWITLPQ